jgi:hypothetical protein
VARKRAVTEQLIMAFEIASDRQIDIILEEGDAGRAPTSST